jgi:poly(3-hydroxybutyrate) depolymerase
VARAGKLETPYLLDLPAGYDGKSPVPLVFAFHGRTRSHQQMRDTDSPGLAPALGGYAVAWVKSLGGGFDQPREQRENLQLFDALYAELLGNYCVDSEQVFALGHSSGALFTGLLACERAPLLRGVVAIAGTRGRPECPGSTAAQIIHGERDSVVTVTRGGALRDHFLSANGCSEKSGPAGSAGCLRYEGCDSSLPVEWCTHGEPTYQNTNHGWPSFGGAEIARFFASLTRVPHAAGTPLVTNESFDAGSEPWQVSFGGNAEGSSSVNGGALCATITNAGENPWDAQLQFAGIAPETGKSYVIDYRVWTSRPSDVRVKVGLDAAPWTEYWVQNVGATPQPQRVTDRFVLADKAAGTLGLGFQFAGYFAREVPLTLCIDDVSVTLAK